MELSSVVCTPTAHPMACTHEQRDVMDAMKAALRPFVGPGEMLMWRSAFRWHNDQGVLPNHYESQDIDYLCEEFGYELVHDFCHLAIVKRPAR